MDERLQRARLALEGLSVGDALGGFYAFSGRSAAQAFATRTVPSAPWRWTDDTNMALSIYAVLRQRGEIKQDVLALSFATHFDRLRGYGMGARTLINRIKKGEYWHDVTKSMFGGTGSYGNGGAMRVALVGAYFADDLPKAVEQARLSAEITHSHPEGIAGASAIAIAAAVAWNTRNQTLPPQAFIEAILPHVPESAVKSGLETAIDVSINAAEILGNGSKVSAQDSVPFAVWNAAHHLTDYEEAIWQAISAGGDVDTLCAMVGGIVACHSGYPEVWQKQREPLPDWAINED